MDRTALIAIIVLVAGAGMGITLWWLLTLEQPPEPEPPQYFRPAKVADEPVKETPASTSTASAPAGPGYPTKTASLFDASITYPADWKLQQGQLALSVTHPNGYPYFAISACAPENRICKEAVESIARSPRKVDRTVSGFSAVRTVIAENDFNYRSAVSADKLVYLIDSVADDLAGNQSGALLDISRSLSIAPKTYATGTYVNPSGNRSLVLTHLADPLLLFKVNVVQLDCVGAVGGFAEPGSTPGTFVMRDPGTPACTLTLSESDGKFLVSENGCSYYRGGSCTFADSYAPSASAD